REGVESAPAVVPTDAGNRLQGQLALRGSYFQLNSIANGTGVPDGIVRYWFDGQLVIEHANVLLRTGTHPSMKFNQLLIAPYIGRRCDGGLQPARSRDLRAEEGVGRERGRIPAVAHGEPPRLGERHTLFE